MPARTEPLGQQLTRGELTRNENLAGFTTSNQDHSAEFHGYYAEHSPDGDIQQRAAYWNLVLDRSLDLRKDIEGDLTGLENGIGLDSAAP